MTGVNLCALAGGIYKLVVYISKVSIYIFEISKFRYMEISNVFCPPSPGIPVLFMRILNKNRRRTYIRSSIKYRKRTYRLFFGLSVSNRTPHSRSISNASINPTQAPTYHATTAAVIC